MSVNQVNTIFTPVGANPLSKAAVSRAGVKRVFVKSIKSYCVALKGLPTTTLSLPKKQRISLGVTHRYITVQLFVPLTKNCSIELRLSDTNHCTYRLILSTALKASHAMKIKPGHPLHFQVPLPLQRNRWCRVVLDVAQLTHATFGEMNEAMFRTVDAISVTANCRIRNIFSTLEDPLADSSLVPQHLELVTTTMAKVNDVFVDGTTTTTTMLGGKSKERRQPRQPLPSPVPTLPTPVGGVTPSLPTPSRLTFAFGTRVSEETPSFVTPPQEGNGERRTPPKSSSRRRTPGGDSSYVRPLPVSNQQQQQQNSGMNKSYEQNIPKKDIDNDEIPF